MKLMWSTLAGMPVMLRDGQRPLGAVNGVFMNPETGQIIAFLVGLARVLAPIDVAQWEDSQLFIHEKEALASPSDILRLEAFGLRRSFLNNKRVRSASGKNMGRVRDFTLDVDSGHILDLEVAKGVSRLTWAKRQFKWKHIKEVTETAIILNLEPESMEFIGARRVNPAPLAS